MIKRLAIVALLSLSACGQDSYVLSNDGSKDLGYCDSATWIECVSGFCSNGYDVVHKSMGGVPSIIKCKPEPVLSPMGNGHDFRGFNNVP